MDLGREHVEAAARRLSGVLVASPLIGDLLLPGHARRPGLRVKAECLQPGGSVWFRGAMHALARRLGSVPGVVAAGAFRPVLAGVVAAALQRVPSVAVVPSSVSRRERELLGAAGVGEVVCAADVPAVAERAKEVCRTRGLFAMPEPGDLEHDLGVATLGLELARDLGTDAEVVLVSPGSLSAPVAAGLAAGGRRLEVVGVEPSSRRPEVLAALRDAVAAGVRLACDPDGLAALDAALDGRYGDHPCVVLGS